MPATHESDSSQAPGHSTQVLEVVSQFEEAWQRGQRPGLADYLPADGGQHWAVLVELVHVDLERRLKAGELVCVEAYLARWPELADDAAVVVDLLTAEYELRRRQEPGLGADDYVRRFPQHRERLRDRLHRPAEQAESLSEARTVPPAPPPSDDLCARRPPTLKEELPPAAAASNWPSVAGYEVLDELGRGGMGVVYKARQVKLNRLVALKMILAGAYAGEDALTRFRTEAEAVARLQHPNIVQIHEVGEADGKPFFSLEFCDGGSLADQLAGTPLPPPEAARLVETLARAMDAAHRAGIIHRDLKPANILLTFSGRSQTGVGQAAPAPLSERPLNEHTPKITDFGLAKKLDSGTGQTASGAIMGTPSHMAPEQAGGRNKEVGPLADVYALGAILYELLTGRPPFKAATAMDTLLLVLSEEPVPPRQLQPKLPRDLETICLRCLQKEPKKRYGRAADLAEDLRRFGASEPIQARPVSRWERGVKWAKRRPAVAALLAALVLAALGMMGGGTWFTISLQRALGVAEDERDKADQARKDADAGRTKAEWLVYAGQIALAQREWRDGDVAHALDLLDACPWNLRGWEHDYIYTLCTKNQRTLQGHSVPVWSVAFSPDGKRLISGGCYWGPLGPGQPGEIKVWDVQTGQLMLSLPGPCGAVRSVALSPDGKRLVSGSDEYDKQVGEDIVHVLNGELKVWDAQTGQELLSLRGHHGGVRSAVFSPDGKRLASGSGGVDPWKHAWRAEVNIWDAQTGQLVLTLEGHTYPVTSVAFSPDGKRLASASRDETVKVWDAQTGQLIRSLQAHAGEVWSVAFSPDGKHLLSGSEDGTVRVWDALTGRETLSLQGHTGRVLSVAFSPDGKRLLSGSRDRDRPGNRGEIKVWDARTGHETLSLVAHTGGVHSVAFSPDGKHLASAGNDKTLKVWDAQATQENLTLKAHTGGVHSVAFSPDGKRLLSGGYDEMVKVWNAQTGQLSLSLQGHTNTVRSVAFSPDGKRLASASFKGVKVWDAQSGQEIFSLKGHTHAVSSVAHSPDGKRLASGSRDKTVKVWDAHSGQETLSLQGHTGDVDSVAFSPDGQRLASGSADHTLKVWDAQTGQETLSLKGHTSAVTSVVFSPDGNRLASASDDSTVKVWDAQTGKETLTLKGHAYAVQSVAFSPDGKRLASGGWDRTVKVWDAQTGQETLSLKGHTWAVTSVAFSPDGKLLASASEDGTVKIWDASSSSEVAPPKE
jgi:WD40 repeat protein/serine/threonine protein kinase